MIPGVVSEPDSEILDLERFSFTDRFNTDNFAGRLLELAKLTQEIPKSTLNEKSHSNI